MRRDLLVALALVVGVALVPMLNARPVLAQETTTTTTEPPTTTTTANPCGWEHGGLVETPPVPCPEAAATPPWALLAGALLVFVAFARLIGGWRT